MALPLTVTYKGEEWFMMDNMLLSIKDNARHIMFDLLSEYELDQLCDQLQERQCEVDAMLEELTQRSYMMDNKSIINQDDTTSLNERGEEWKT
jgi:hypothetical protein